MGPNRTSLAGMAPAVVLLFLSLFFLRAQADVGQGYTCNEDTPCSNGACCGASGYCGYGDTYCGKGCQSNCDAKAACGQYSASGDATCPLNVCCSQFGFCGTTADFCGTGCQSNCGKPSKPGGTGGDVRDLIIGYYENWRSNGEECGIMEPSQIPVEGVNIINFAFAYVTPDTFEIVPMPGSDASLFKKVADIKSRNPDLKVWVSVGGWSFNDNGTSTQPVFPDIAGSFANTLRFGTNLLSFMMQYGFDGVDLDWEYPGAGDRGGRGDEDIKNYAQMLADLRSIFDVITNRGWNSRLGLSITAPTSYWYLRWFDLPAIAEAVDYINMMAYDLHGTWDSTDPIGSYVYAHTNLTEIDQALDLFWRNDISPSKINLGLAFYGRSFQLTDPSCTAPGCPFKGPGASGACTNTAGILSWREIQQIRNDKSGDYYETYDEDAAINYMVYGGEYWVSFDDKNTFQKKIDYANSLGLNGLFIWAVDQDDDSLTALKAVTGKDLTPTPGISYTYNGTRASDCVITGCGSPCPGGWTKMTGLNKDASGEGCSGGNHTQRSLCCPALGAPDPGTCSWYGKASECYGQCKPGEVLLATDNYGGSKHCNTGVKAFCCPATSGNLAVDACQDSKGKSCPANLPQQISQYGSRVFCCPAEPVFNNCSWHGAKTTCKHNRCPVDQIEMLRSSRGDSTPKCVLGRQKVLCCDPPFGNSAFIPVPLEDLFPETFSSTDEPVYYEAFEEGQEDYPAEVDNGAPDPNKEAFAWTIMVGAEEDVVSLRRRDGSHLAAFECPEPAADDYSTQSFKVVCTTAPGDESNCHDIRKGGVKGTILRMPEGCGPDEWVRAVSFRQLPDHPIPGHLTKRAPVDAAVYEIRYDYNLRQVRRDAGEIYIRFDASDHAGYWDEIVKSKPGDAVKKREAEDWRAFHMDWFERRGFVDGSPTKRGYAPSGGSSDDSWWLDRFKKLLSGDGLKYGMTRSYDYNQVLYSANRSCPGSAVDAHAQVSISGSFKTKLDFGLSLIGTLRNFGLQQSYAYFSMDGTDFEAHIDLDAYAAFQMQSKMLPILQNIDVFGTGFNIKGLWIVGPYMNLDAKLQSLATISGSVSAGASITATGLTWMYPQTMNEAPTQDQLQPFPLQPIITAGVESNADATGSLTVTVVPELGFQIRLDTSEKELINTRVRATIEASVTLNVGVPPADCAGAYYGVDAAVGMSIGVVNPFSGMNSANYTVMPSSPINLRPLSCFEWSSSDSSSSAATAKRALDAGVDVGPETHVLARRSGIVDALFPDALADLIACPKDFNSPTGDCAVKVGNLDVPADSVVAKREISDIDDYEDYDNYDDYDDDSAFDLAKRDAKLGITFCYPPVKYSTTTSRSPDYLASSKLIGANSNVFSFGPLKPDDCDDYTFGKVATPPVSDSANWNTEHVLEWQILSDFLIESPELGFSYGVWRPNAVNFTNTRLNRIFGDLRNKNMDFCQYMKLFWDQLRVTDGTVTMRPIDWIIHQFPGNNNGFANEMPLLDAETNLLKGRLFGTPQFRTPETMQLYIDEDINKAINVCKNIMNSVLYMQLQTISDLFVKQATRIGQKFDSLETKLQQISPDNVITVQQYQPLGLGDAWRAYMTVQFDLANIKQKDFLSEWVQKIYDSTIQSGNSAGGAAIGGQQTNPAIKKRVEALKAAYDKFLLTPWESPFPSTW